MKKSKTIKEGVHLVWKEVGETPNEAIQKFRKENIEYDFLPMTYAGRLDPMAEGLLVLLSGEETKNKEKYLGLSKKYIFEMLWGVETDTHDILGLQVDSRKLKVESKIPDEKKIAEYLKKNTGKFEQYYPMYSSRPVGGKPLFEWAREGKIGDVDIPKHEVEVFQAEFLERREIKSEELLGKILSKVNLVSGDFRQEEIKEKWKEILKEDREFVLDKIEIEVSSGFYVRQFTTDIAKSFGALATTFSIVRTEVGEYKI